MLMKPSEMAEKQVKLQDLLANWNTDPRRKGQPRPKHFAVKKIPKWRFENGPELEALLRECRILSSFNPHPRIVELYNIVASDTFIYIILEYA
eukprot:GSA120T00005218001.1